MVLNDVFIRVTQFKKVFSKAKCCYDFNEQVTTKYKVVLYMPKTLYSISKLGIHCNKIGNIQNYNCTNSTKKGGKRNRKSVHQAKAATTSTLITSQTSKHTSHYL